MISRLVSFRPTVYALTVAAALAVSGTADAQQEPRLDVIYVPTPQEVVDRMLQLAKVGPGDYMIDFGCGDGRMVPGLGPVGVVRHHRAASDRIRQ